MVVCSGSGRRPYSFSFRVATPVGNTIKTLGRGGHSHVYSVFPTLPQSSLCPMRSRAGRFGDGHGSLREHNLFLHHSRDVPPNLLPFLAFLFEFWTVGGRGAGAPDMLVEHPKGFRQTDHLALEQMMSDHQRRLVLEYYVSGTWHEINHA